MRAPLSTAIKTQTMQAFIRSKYSLQTRLPSITLLTLLAFFCDTLSLSAQTTATFIVPLSRSTITQSNTVLFQNALYRWTIAGRGSAGQVIASPTQVDARFFVSNVSIVQGVANPRMPLEVNGAAAAQYCTAFTTTPAASPCNVYLAANMTRTSPAQPALQNASFRLTDAVQLKQFAFVPDNDTYNPNNIYTATVRGANLPAQMVFVDRLGFNSNAAYNDNQDSLSVRIERQSPELLLSARPSFAVASLQAARILNDDRPRQSFRDTVLDFGSFRIGSALQTRRLVLYNRGSEPLSVRMEADDPSGIFSVSSPSGNIGAQRFINQTNDSLVLFLTYQPRTAGTQTLEVRIFTNDSAINSSAGQGVFRLRLVGATTSGIISLTAPPSQFQNNTLLFGSSIGDAATQTYTTIGRTFSFTRAASVQEGFTIDSVQRTPQSPFAFASPDPLTLLPFTIDQLSTAQFTSTILFRPTRLGDYLDSITIRGQNLEDYTLYLRGRAEIAEAAIERTTAPIEVDTLDFGSLVTGASAVRSVIVRNIGNLPLTIQSFLDTGGDAKEFTVLQSAGNLPETTGSVLTTSISYNAQTQFSAGNKQAFFTVIVRNTATGNIVAQRRYTLRANRLPNVLVAARSVINFDSVYVQRERLDTTLIRNASPRYAATLDSQAIAGLSPLSEREFFADTLGVVASARLFRVGTTGTPGLRYRPLNRGVDTANFRLKSRIDSTGGAEELTVQLRGVGVEQDVSVARLFALSGVSNSVFAPVSSSSINGYRVYTADIGCVRLGESRTVGVLMQNRGNIAFGLARQFRTDSMNLSPAFSITRPFTTSRNLAPNGDDTSLAIRFTPQTLGVQELRYVLESDIKRRVPSAPDSTEQIIIVLRGRGIVPQVQVQDALRFEDNTLGSQCSVQKDLPLLVKNPLSDSCGVPLVVKSVVITTLGAPFFATPSKNLPLTVQPTMSDTIKISFDPKLVGDKVGSYTATLLLLTDAPSPNDSIRVTITGNIVNLPSVILSAPRDSRASPGTSISIPILVTPAPIGSAAQNAKALESVSIAKFAFTFDESLLSYKGYKELGTASEGAAIVVQRGALLGFDRTIQVTITSRDKALRALSERLILLDFDTYLGRGVSTPLTFSNYTLGDVSCTERARITTTTNGTFTLDSVCGLEAKTSAINKATSFLLSDISPNPVSDNLRVGFQVAYKTRVTVEILDALGQVRTTVVDNEFPEGAFEGDVSTVNLSPGLYFCRMRAGRFSDMRKIVIIR